MKQGHYLTIEKAFKGYKRNLAALRSYPYPYVSGVDYSKPRVTGDGYKNGQEQMIWSCIDKKDDLEKQVRLVEEVVRWFEIEGYGRERYIKYRYFKGATNLNACYEIGISEKTGKNWKRDIFYKAEAIAENIGIFQKSENG